jgi:hypothetical protein
MEAEGLCNWINEDTGSGGREEKLEEAGFSELM